MAATASPQFVSLPCPRCCRTRRVYLCRRRRVYFCRRRRVYAAVARLQCSPAKAVAAEAAAVEMGNRIGTVGLPRPDAMGRFRRFGSKYVPESLTTLATEFQVYYLFTHSAITFTESVQMLSHSDSLRMKFLVDILKNSANERGDNIPVELQDLIKQIQGEK